jgi:subfamily B ATP-binding cassette protein MsbA
VALAILAAMFEGAGLGLLIPILNGFLQKSFSFVTEAPILGPFVQMLPPSILENDRLIFGVLLGGFIAIYILKSILRFLSVVTMAYMSERTIHHLRKALFSRYLSFGKFFFDNTNIGHHGAVLLEFSRYALQPLIAIDKIVNALFALLAYIIVMLMISWRLTLIALPLFFILHMVIKNIIVRLRMISHATVERGSDLNKKSVEILSTMPLVKSYRTERLEQQRYTKISDEKARLQFRSVFLLSIIQPLQENVMLLVVCAIFAGSLYAFGRDEIASAPALIVYFYVVMNAASKLGQVSGFRGTLANTVGPLNAVLEVFDDNGKYFVRGGNEEFPGLQKEINCKNLSFSYTEREVLKGMNFTIKKGQMTAIVGPSGAGKSTLIHLLMRYYDCPPESIFVDGKDIRTYTLDSYLRHIAIVSQETLLLHDSLRNNIMYGLEGVTEEMLQDVVRRARLKDFVNQLPQGLDTLIGDRGVRLSGGEKQRVSIARALLKGAEILILDEATSSLDSQTEKLIQEAVDEAVAGRTAIVIAHRLSTIKHADKIVVLKDGTVTEQGTLDELLKEKGTFFHLWEEQKF